MPTAVLLLFVIIASRDTLAFSGPHQTRRQQTTRFTSTLAAKRVRRIDTAQGAATNGPRRATTASRGSSRTRTQQQAPPVVSKRAPHQFDHTKDEARPFVDARTEIQNQQPNEDAPAYELGGGDDSDAIITHAHIQTVSLDDLFPGLDFSRTFVSSTDFRTDLRAAIREDIFDTTPAYHGMSEKARKVLLLPDSSIQGSWKCENGGWAQKAGQDNTGPRMQRSTETLKKYLGPEAPTGDEFMDKIGTLCGSKPTTHWIDIVGVMTRRIPHSWRHETGRSPKDSKTVLLGFPPTDNYDGVGVFDHFVKLKRERREPVPDDDSRNEPVLYGAMADDIGDEFIVRPRFAEGRELIVYRDINVLQSSPDVAYRASVMRFM